MKFGSECDFKLDYDVKLYRRKYYSPNEHNTLFNELIQLKRNSSLHGNILNDKVRRVFGSGFLSEDLKTQMLIKTKYNKIFYKCTADFELFGGTYIYIRWNVDHSNILVIKHVPFEKVRVGADDMFYIKEDWNGDVKPIVYPAFNIEQVTGGEQILFIKMYEPGSNDIYPIPSYFSGVTAIRTDINIAKYFDSTVRNNFGANTILEVPAFEDVEKKSLFERTFKDRMTGPDNGGGILILYKTGDPENKITANRINSDINADTYLAVGSATTQRILNAHGVPSGLLYGIETAGSLGNSNEMEMAETIYESTVIAPVRNILYEEFMMLNAFLLSPMAKDTYIESISIITQNEDLDNTTDTDVQTKN